MAQGNPMPGEQYLHFKNKRYQVIAVAYHSETKERYVVYQALYGDFLTYVRPYDMFISEVDHEKYPDVEQKFRFQYLGNPADVRGTQSRPSGDLAGAQETRSGSSSNLAQAQGRSFHNSTNAQGTQSRPFGDSTNAQGAQSQPFGNSSNMQGIQSQSSRNSSNWQENQAETAAYSGENATGKDSGVQTQPGSVQTSASFKNAYGKENASTQNAGNPGHGTEVSNEPEEGQLNPWLDKFLDATSFDEKYQIVCEMQNDVTDKLIDDIAVVMDLAIPDGNLRERYAQLKYCMRTRQKYESGRLR